MTGPGRITRAHDYARWFRNGIKDEDLAGETAGVEEETSLSARESRVRIKAMWNGAIRRRSSQTMMPVEGHGCSSEPIECAAQAYSWLVSSQRSRGERPMARACRL
jgi:hypothetical protein